MKKIAIYILSLFVTTFAWSQNLDSHLKIAAENNPGLKAAFKAYEAALQKVNQVSALPDPSLDFGYFISPIETRVGPQRAKIGIMQMFPWRGTLTAKEKVFANLAKANYELFEGEKKKLFFQVESVWYELLELEAAVKIMDEHLNILHSFESLSTQKFETGAKSGMVDVLRIQLEIEEVKNKRLLLMDKFRFKKIQFNNTLNRDPATVFSISNPHEILSIIESKESINDSIRLLNNEVKSMEMKKAAFESTALLAKKQGLPMLGLGVNYFVISKSNMNVQNSGKDAIMPMVSISMPIYRKKIKAQTMEANLNVEGMDYQLQNKQNQLNTDLELNWLHYEDAGRRIELYAQQNKKAEMALEIIINSYTNSGKDFEEILRVQRMMLNYDLNRIQAIKDKNVAVCKIASMQ